MISLDEHKRSEPELVVSQLISELGAENVLTTPSQLLPYETDAMPIHRLKPLCVVLPVDQEMLSRTIKILSGSNTPFVARGAGSGLSGGALAADNGVVVSLSRLCQIIKLDPLARRATVEPGLVNIYLNQAVASLGLQFAPDPSSQTVSTIGGNIAENAGGPHTLKVGVTAQHVTGLRLIQPDTTVLTLGGKEETMGGYDLVSFLHGSEGTLGLFSEATVRLTPLPESTATFLAVFDTATRAGAAVSELLGQGFVPSALELIDNVVLEALEEAFAIHFPGETGAVLIGEIDGLREAVVTELPLIENVLLSAGASKVRLTRDAAERDRLWLARKQAFGALGRIAPNYISHDTVIPRSQLAAVLDGIATVSRRSGLKIANIFHAGDGNLHPAILFDAANAKQTELATRVGDELVRLCLDAGGVLTGEHGIGLSKRHILGWAFSDEEIRLMNRLTMIFDPWCLANPQKLLPDIPGEKTPLYPGLKRPERILTTSEMAVQNKIQEANRERRSLLPLGGGTLRIAPLCGRSTLDLTGLSKIIRYHPADYVVEVEPGLTLDTLSETLSREGQELAWEAPDPSSATIGGIVSAGYWGSKTQQLGHPKYSLLGFRGISGGGEFLEFGGPVVKNVSGYDVPRLMVGTAGTLLVTTRLTLRTYPIAPERKIVKVTGETDGVLALAAVLALCHIPWSRLDLYLDDKRIDLYIGVDGHPEVIKRQLAEIDKNRNQLNARFSRKSDLDTQQISGEDVPRIQCTQADWLRWSDSVMILRLVVSPDKTISLVQELLQLLQADNAMDRCRLQANPGIGLVRIAFDSGFDDAILRRIVLMIAEIVRAAGGYRALDRAPGNPWWGWDGWGTSRMLYDRMQRIQLVFDPQGVLPSGTPGETMGNKR